MTVKEIKDAVGNRIGINPLALLLSVGTSFSVLFLFTDFEAYSQLVVFLAVGLYVVYKPMMSDFRKSNVVSVKILSCFLALLLAISLVLSGGIEKVFEKIYHVSTDSAVLCFSIVFLAVFLWFLIVYVVNVVTNLEFKRFESKTKKRTFFIIWGTMFLVWLFFYFCYYPGIITSDSISQLYITNGLSGWSNHHPVLHTLLIKVLMTAGGQSPVLYMLFQMLTMSAIYSYCCYYLRQRSVYKWLWYLSIGYFAFHPIHSYSSFTMTKDTLFSGMLLLFSLCLYEIVYTKGDCFKKTFFGVMLFASALLVMFFRNNGFLAILLSALAVPFLLKKVRIKSVGVLLAALTVYFLCTNFLYPALNIIQSSPAESLAIPIQQIARVVYEGRALPEDTVAYINSIIPIEDLVSNYSSGSVDGLKFHENFDISVISSDMMRFIKVWAEILIQYPVTYFEAYFLQTESLWNLCVHEGLIENFYDSTFFTTLRMTPLFEPVSGMVRSFIDVSQFSSFGFITTPFWNVAVCYLVFCMGYLISLNKKQKSNLLIILPVVGVWLSLALAIPASLVGRYALSAFACLPLILASVSIPNKEKE